MNPVATHIPPLVATRATPETSASASDASRGSAIRLGIELVVRLSSVIATLWLTRSLGVPTFGGFLLALSLGLMVAELCDLGLNAIVVPLVVRSRGNLRTLFRLKALATGGVVALCGLLLPLVAWMSGIPAGLLALTTLHFIGASWIDMAGAALRALGRRADEAMVLLVFRLTLVGLVISAPFGMSVRDVTLSYALAVAPAILVAGSLLRSADWVERSTSGFRAILRQAAPMGVNGYLAILSTRVEIFLLQGFQGAHAVGLFGGALRIVESLLTLPAAIAAGALPSVSRDVVSGSRGAAQRTLGLVIWLGVPSAVGLALCAPEILAVLGPGFVDGAWVLRILSASLFLCFSNAALFHVLIAAGETNVIPRLTGLRVGTALFMGVLLIPTLGLVGGALSFTTAELVLFGALIRAARAHAEVDATRPFSLALLACVPMAVMLLAVPLSLPISILTGALSFAVAAAMILRRGTVAAGLS